MKVLVLLCVVFSVCFISVVGADSVTFRTDESAGKTQHSLLVAHSSGVELRLHNYDGQKPLSRVGYMTAIDGGKAGAFIAERNGQRWLNPSVVLAGKVSSAKYLTIGDYYHPLDGGKSIIAVDGHITWPVGPKTSVGPGLNLWWEEGKAKLIAGSLVLKHQISKEIGVYARWNCAGSAPHSLRIDMTVKF